MVDVHLSVQMEERGKISQKVNDKQNLKFTNCPVAIKVPKRILTRPNKITVENTSEKDFVWKMICWIDSKVSKEDSLDHNNEDLH